MVSKAYNIIFTRELAERLENAGSKITVNSLHPGVVKTNLLPKIVQFENEYLKKIVDLFMSTMTMTPFEVLCLVSF